MGEEHGREITEQHKSRVRRIKKAESVVQELFSRVEEDTDPFASYYRGSGLIEPPFSFPRLYDLYHKSDLLQVCVSAYTNNVDGFGHKFEFIKDDVDRNSPSAKAELQKAMSFCSQVNENQDLSELRADLRIDDLVLGNAAMEVVTNLGGEIQMLFHVPFRMLRVSRKGPKISAPVQIERNGKIVEIPRRRAFRKFAQIDSSGKELVWFKEHGDPRPMNWKTGAYESSKYPATSIVWMKRASGGYVYGVPIWLGSALEVMGRYAAQYINFDMFSNQGIPPMAVMVSNGTLSDESFDELESIFASFKGYVNFNRVVVLETDPAESMGLDSSTGNAKIELKNLTEYRKEDLMFGEHLKAARKNIRGSFRLPPLYTGDSDDYTRATALAAMEVTEQQVFIPERGRFDSQFNRIVLRDGLKCHQWELRSKGPRITGTEETTRGVATFAKVGALSINRAIEMLNAAFGMEVSRIDKEWADLPVMLIDKLLAAGQLPVGISEMIEQLDKTTDELKKKSGGATGNVIDATNVFGERERDQTGANRDRDVPPAERVKKSDLVPLLSKTRVFTEDEKDLYLRLAILDQAVTQHTSEVIEDADLEL